MRPQGEHYGHRWDGSLNRGASWLWLERQLSERWHSTILSNLKDFLMHHNLDAPMRVSYCFKKQAHLFPLHPWRMYEDNLTALSSLCRRLIDTYQNGL